MDVGLQANQAVDLDGPLCASPLRLRQVTNQLGVFVIRAGDAQRAKTMQTDAVQGTHCQAFPSLQKT